MLKIITLTALLSATTALAFKMPKLVSIEGYFQGPSLDMSFDDEDANELYSYQSEADMRTGATLIFEDFSIGYSSAFSGVDRDDSEQVNLIRSKSNDFFIYFPSEKFITKFVYQDFEDFNLYKTIEGVESQVGILPGVKARNIGLHLTSNLSKDLIFVSRSKDFKDKMTVHKGWYYRLQLSYNELDMTNATSVTNEFGIGRGQYKIYGMAPSFGYQWAKKWNEFAMLFKIDTGLGPSLVIEEEIEEKSQVVRLIQAIGIGMSFLYEFSNNSEIGIEALSSAQSSDVKEYGVMFQEMHTNFFYRYNF